MIATLDQEVNRLRRQVEIETEASKVALESQLASLEFDVKTINERLKFLEKEHKKREALLREGLIILNVVQDFEGKILEVPMRLLFVSPTYWIMSN